MGGEVLQTSMNQKTGENRDNILEKRRIISVKKGQSLTGAIKKAILKEHNIRLTNQELLKLASEVTLIDKSYQKNKNPRKNTEIYRGKKYIVYNPIYAGNTFLVGKKEDTGDQNKGEIKRLQEKGKQDNVSDRYPTGNILSSQRDKILPVLDTAFQDFGIQKINDGEWEGKFFTIKLLESTISIQDKNTPFGYIFPLLKNTEKLQILETINTHKNIWKVQEK